MTSIEVMVEEHENIRRMLAVVRKASYKVLLGDDINFDDFNLMIDFIKNYADIHHHGKEEKFLFKEMVNNLGSLGNKLITNGMLVEHDFGRLYMMELKIALDRVKQGDKESLLDVIANAISYTHLLERHIDKENTLVYPFAEKQLDTSVLDIVNSKSKEFEMEASRKGIQIKYMDILNTLEQLYK